MRQGVAGDVHAAALRGRVEDLADGGPDALMGIGDDPLDAAQTAPGELAQKNAVLNVSAFDGPMARPRTSRRPSPLMPTAMITASETTRPFWRTFTSVASIQKTGPVVFKRPLQERLHPGVELLAEPADLGPGDAVHSHRLDQVVDGTGRDALDTRPPRRCLLTSTLPGVGSRGLLARDE
jgi:hypothetical protein